MEIFFYGLFMDLKLLEKNGLHPSNPRQAYLQDYALKIGSRASLLPTPGASAYGLVITVDAAAISALYSEVSVADYVPEPVEVVTGEGEKVAATCYNLPAHLLSGTNVAYAQSLYKLAVALQFPKTYLARIEEFMG